MTTQDDTLRLRLTFQIAGIGIGAVLLAFLVALLILGERDEPAELIIGVMGTVTGVIGTLAGYVAGQTAGAAGKERAEAQREEAEGRATTAQKQLTAVTGASPDAELLSKAKEAFPEWFGETSHQD